MDTESNRRRLAAMHELRADPPTDELRWSKEQLVAACQRTSDGGAIDDVLVAARVFSLCEQTWLDENGY